MVQIAASNQITVQDIENYNKQTWGWTGCNNLMAMAAICLSEGDPPMPNPLPDAECGPQVPGTPKPSNGTKLADLNPCPLNACCDIWGMCGTTDEFCTDTSEPGWGPGSAKPGTNGCISNCGTAIVNNKDPPADWKAIGYFEGFNFQRSCLNMDVRSIDPIAYSHIHFSFAVLTNDYQVDIGQDQQKEQFGYFVQMNTIKRILSFGGWTASTDPSTYMIFRNAVTAANRATAVKNIAGFIQSNNLDGVDIDWEYPGAPDIPGIPPASPEDGPNYLEFLKELKSALPGKTVSIAAPASYWYLKAFPISDIAKVVDYIIYMTYDLHGQWDYAKNFSVPGCPAGNCLRSHVNLTETMNSLTMITKAGVQASKVIVGVASYGRSFEMTQPGCTGPMCPFAGPESGATPGRCTNTAGYIANAEIQEILDAGSGNTWYDAPSGSNMMTYDTNQWVAYMDIDTLVSRTDMYRSLNFGGTTNWAIDLAFSINASSQGGNSGNGDGSGTKSYIPSDTCQNSSNPAAKNQFLSGNVRWEELGADKAWSDAVAWWKGPSDKGGKSFTAAFSIYFGLDHQMECAEVSAGNGCDDYILCNNANGASPAGLLIMNSFAVISKVSLHQCIPQKKIQSE